MSQKRIAIHSPELSCDAKQKCQRYKDRRVNQQSKVELRTILLKINAGSHVTDWIYPHDGKSDEK
ncbi:MAG: hypothetical protein ABSF63_00720 [Candidatus Bathyarchaeia archaeon]